MLKERAAQQARFSIAQYTVRFMNHRHLNQEARGGHDAADVANMHLTPRMRSCAWAGMRKAGCAS